MAETAQKRPKSDFISQLRSQALARALCLGPSAGGGCGGHCLHVSHPAILHSPSDGLGLSLRPPQRPARLVNRWQRQPSFKCIAPSETFLEGSSTYKAPSISSFLAFVVSRTCRTPNTVVAPEDTPADKHIWAKPVALTASSCC